MQGMFFVWPNTQIWLARWRHLAKDV